METDQRASAEIALYSDEDVSADCSLSIVKSGQLIESVGETGGQENRARIVKGRFM